MPAPQVQLCEYESPRWSQSRELDFHCLVFNVSCPRQSEVPQFVVFSADDAVQSYTLDAVNQFLAHRNNPNGCPVKTTYFTSLNYTNYTLVTDWYVAGNEIADHTSVVIFLLAP